MQINERIKELITIFFFKLMSLKVLTQETIMHKRW